METPLKLKWKFAAKVVAVFDMVLTVLLPVTFFCVIIIGEKEHALVRVKLEITQTDGCRFRDLEQTLICFAAFAASFLYGVYMAVELCAAATLYKSTIQENLKTDIAQAIGRSLSWFFVQLACIFLGGIFHYTSGFIWTWILETIVRLVAMSIVFGYVVELVHVADAAGIVLKFPSVSNTSDFEEERPAKQDEMMKINVVIEKK